MNIKNIISLGLSEKEAKIYLASLQLGKASITQLSSKAKIKRPTAYLIIEDLLNMNLLIPFQKGKNIHYQSVSPVMLGKEIERKKTALAKILPELNKLYESSSLDKSFIDYNQENKPKTDNITKSKKKKNIFSVENIFKAFNKQR